MTDRRLTAVLAADVADFDALKTARNKDDILSALKGHHSVVLPMITGYDGRIVEVTDGDILAEFPSVLNAVKCAVTVQELMQERNAATSPEQRVQFRIGIHHGEVIAEQDRIAGEGVNIAKRLDAICDPGSICITGNVHSEVRERYPARYRDIGEQNLPGIAAPVRVYRIGMTRLTTETLPPPVTPMRLRQVAAAQLSQKQWIAAGVAVAVLLVLGAGAIWWSLAPSKPAQQMAEKAPPQAPATASEANPSPPPAAAVAPAAAPASNEPAPVESKVAAAEPSPAPAAAPPASEPAAAPSAPAADKDAILTPSSPASEPPPENKMTSVEPSQPAPAPSPAPSLAPSEPAAQNKDAILAPQAPPAAASSRTESPAASEPTPAPKPEMQAAITPAAPSPAPAAPAPVIPAPTMLGPQAAAAIRDLDQKIASDPRDFDSLGRRGQIFAQNNDFSRAKIDFNEVLLIQPDNVEALNNRCWVNAILGELASAMVDCDAALKLRPAYADALDSRGFVKLKLGLPYSAILDYDAALKLDDRKASSLYGRGIAKQRTGGGTGGDADIAQAKAIDPNVANEFASYGIR